jgi:AAA15 family ATPase/GTPase
MVKTAKHELPENVINVGTLELLKSAVIYGANASGKSNLIKAFDFMRNFTVWSFKNIQIGEKIGVLGFVLNENNVTQPSFFEVVLNTNNEYFKYGFEINRDRVIKEWLCRGQKEEILFERNGDKFNLYNFDEGKELEDKTRGNCLFLSVVSQFNGEISKEIIKCLKKFRVNSSLGYEAFYNRTLDRLEKEPELKKDVLKFVNIADNGIKDFSIEKEDLSEDKDKIVIDKIIRKAVYFVHNIFVDNRTVKGKVKFDLDILESEGTKKMFALSVPIIDALKNGEIIILDELENHLHPLLLKYIVKLFNSYSNKNNAQLIFTTHNLTCMSNECFRRDQIWFTEKNSLGESTLFSLAEYKIDDKKIRSDVNYSKNYMLGKYGAVPFIDEIAMDFGGDDEPPR